MTALKLDHVAFGVLDASDVSDDFSRLGFTVTPLSTCAWDDGSGPATARSASVVFPGQYLDFVEVRHPAWVRHVESSPLHARGAAPSGIVLSGLSRDELRARGPSYEIVRTFQHAERSEIHYEFLAARDAVLPIGLIHDSAPRTMRTAEWTSHPNGATAIRRVHVRAPSAPPPPGWLDIDSLGIHLFETAEDDYLDGIGRLLATNRPALLSIEFAVPYLAAARHCFEQSNVEFHEKPDRLQVAPGEGFGFGVQLGA